MRVLAIEPYCGGSHAMFIDGWRAHSRHEWIVFGLPDRNWMKRMRRGAGELAAQVAVETSEGDVLFCSDMLDLATFKKEAPVHVATLPSVIYFHENQLTYPMPVTAKRDDRFSFINIESALCADQVWFNSRFHRNEFFAAARRLLEKTPGRDASVINIIADKTAVYPQGIYPSNLRRSDVADEPPHILWAARWEHDKDPVSFFKALSILRGRGADFRLSVVGGKPTGGMAPIFNAARCEFSGIIENWGWQETRADYENVLLSADVIVSTALHEFFGISIVEAVGFGVYPVVPKRLAYPEVLNIDENPDFFYDNTVDALALRLEQLVQQKKDGTLWGGTPCRGIRTVAEFLWVELTPRLDAGLTRVAKRCPATLSANKSEDKKTLIQ